MKISFQLIQTEEIAGWSSLWRVHISHGAVERLGRDELLALYFHELGHIRGLHLVQRWALVLSVVGWPWLPRLAKWQELRADAYAASKVGPEAVARLLQALPHQERTDFYPSTAERVAALGL